jgi:tetratricopeptide (TPR) repeat protein
MALRPLLFRLWPVWLLLFVVVVGGGVGLYLLGSRWWWDNLPPPDSEQYRQYVRAFQVGVGAMDAKAKDELARSKLDEAVRLVPQEPAGWANRGLLNIRTNKFKAAARDLNRAKQLAPDSGEIEMLLGLLAQLDGRLPEAVEHLQRGLEKDPSDVSAVYALAQAIHEESGKESEAKYQELMEKILKFKPNNLKVLIERAGAALHRKDMRAFRDSMDRLTRLSNDWKASSRKLLTEVTQLAAKNPEEATDLLPQLDNTLKQERTYHRDFRQVQPDGAFVGSPVQQFLRLYPMRPSAAPPDLDLNFTIEPIPGLDASAKVRWNVVRLLWQMNEKQRKGMVSGAGPDDRAIPAFPEVYVANGTQARRATAGARILPFPGGERAIAPTMSGVVALDWNNDFREDLLLVGAGGLRFWQRQPDGTFADVTKKTQLSGKLLQNDYYGAWAADIDMDGDLDIIVARRSGPALLLRNNRDGTFTPLDTFAAVKDVRSLVWVDLNNDGAADAVFLDKDGNLHVFANEFSGRFSPWPLPRDLGKFLAVTAADINHDGIFDLVALRQDGKLIRISDKDKGKSWQVADIADWSGDTKAMPGTVQLFVQDLDNNGTLDLVVAGPKEAQVFLADEQDQFVALAKTVPLQVFAVVDLNEDGRLDLLGLSSEGQLVRALNKGKRDYHAQVIWPLANPKPDKPADRINSFGIGGEVEIRSGLLVQKQPIHGPVVHFGLGEQDAVAVTRFVWPNGIPQYAFDTPNGVIAAQQQLFSSCPFLFTHDGKRVQFVADFMWNTPLGMYVNGQNTGPNAQTTEWLKIRGDLLAPHDGYYDVRVHANLWEADYFDQLALMVVDHPPGTEVHVDERFSMTSTPPSFQITGPARPVARAWDHLGKDAKREVSKVDGIYLDRAGRGDYQGITVDHWVEADLGPDAPTEGPVWLIARGWLHPTDSSINLAISQGKHDQPRGLMLEVPDGKGGWKVGRPALGFPAGKNKTMLIRLDDIEGPGIVTRRFRLRTNMEIFWDFLGYARGLDSKLAKVQRPEMVAADLRYKGILEMTQKDRSSPELPNYDNVTHGAQVWRDLEGYYTRYGDVRELLARVDDRYVIANAGDEIALRFKVPPPPPGGWVRDFIWECDGWTRDGNPNTRFGRTVLPLPAHDLKDFDRPPGRLEDDPVYRRFPQDWRTYHTRYVAPDLFELGLRTFRRPAPRR